MSRPARQKNESGIYHIMLRGTNRQEIFHDEDDCLRFLETIKRFKEKAEMKVHGWCLMGNHAHLLLQEGNEDISTTIKRIGVSYAWYYNQKYHTTGHLFQDRFKSEGVKDDKQLLAVIRYIHQNPVKAGIVKMVEEWRWSSCQEYYRGRGYPEGLLDSEIVLDLFSKQKKRAITEFQKFNQTENEDICLDQEKGNRMTDEEAREEIKKRINGSSIAEVKSLPKQQRDILLAGIKEIKGLSNRQAARILGISRNLIDRA